MKWNGKLLAPLLLILFFSCAKEFKNPVEYRQGDAIQLIPQVSFLKVDTGYFELNKSTVILTWNDSTSGANYLQKLIGETSNFTPAIIKIKGEEYRDYPNYIMLNNESKTIGVEAYSLNIDSNRIAISAMTNQGVFHGIQTLMQLFMVDFFKGEKRNNWYLPVLEIEDAPAFQHRGMWLDCARHFFEVKTIKRYIDLLAFYKMNVFHWHLTEDQAWRIQIDQYPNLTTIGSKRIEGDGTVYEGFYTKADIKEIVAYAQERHVTIIPEIELPGHAQAAIAAYPYLSCTQEQVDVANDWGVFKEIYCAGNDSVFTFLTQVLTEVIALFPGKYIHIGGDEAPKYRWEHCQKCQQRMVDNDLKDEHELQSYFIQRIEKFLNSHGKSIIGWDEILEGGLSENATVQSWRGMEGGLAAANSAHFAIMSPTSHAYFDYDIQAIDLKKVYEFNPIPDSLPIDKHAFILGGECNLWSEHIPTQNKLDQQVFPRLLAMSEVLWSAPTVSDYDAFFKRVQGHLSILDELGVNYGMESQAATIKVHQNEKYAQIELLPGNNTLVLKYRWGSSEKWIPYEQQIDLNQSDTLWVQAYKNKKPFGDPIFQIFSIHQGVGKMVTYKNDFSAYYPAGESLGLVDGKIGSLDFRDGNWQGFWGEDLEILLKFDHLQSIESLECNFYQYNNSWIFMPTQVVYSGSKDGKTFEEIAVITSKTAPEKRGKKIEKFEVKFEPKTFQYIKVVAKNIGKVPNWHEAAGADAWLFIDEIQVR